MFGLMGIINPTLEEKLLICFECVHLKNKKCQFAKCMGCFNAMLNARLGKCPINKWTVDINEFVK
jgi:hypothetical protein